MYIDFGDHRSKVKVMMGITDKCGVRRMLGFALLYLLYIVTINVLVRHECLWGIAKLECVMCVTVKDFLRSRCTSPRGILNSAENRMTRTI